MSPIAMAFWRWLAAFLILLPFVARPIAREWRDDRALVENPRACSA